jgi:hypothetical protein
VCVGKFSDIVPVIISEELLNLPPSKPVDNRKYDRALNRFYYSVCKQGRGGRGRGYRGGRGECTVAMTTAVL